MRARIKQDEEEYAYRVYMTDSAHYRGENKYLTYRWEDVIGNRIDTRTGDEIAADIINGAGLRFASEE